MHSSIAYIKYSLKTLFSSLPRAYCREDTPAQSLGQLTLYQYNTCPFCCKVKAYLNARKIKYSTVEVDPLLKREIKFSSYKKVPFLIIDGKRVEDSSLIISVLESFRVSGKPLETILSYFPLVVTKEGKRDVSEYMNKYVITYGDATNLDARREESNWRQWVDDTFIHKLPVNIYRSPSEALRAFDYLMEIEGFSFSKKFLGKYIGAFSMYLVSKRLKKRHSIFGDVREELFHDGEKWVSAIGRYRSFLGGDEPNLADISVYGVLSSIEGLDTFRDLMAQNAKLAKWYKEVKSAVGTKASN